MDTVLLTILVSLLVTTFAILYLNIRSKPKSDTKQAEEISNLNAEIIRLKDSLNSTINDFDDYIKNYKIYTYH